MVWLVRGDLTEARRVLKDATWAPPVGTYHLQHWYAFRAEREMNLYERAAGELWESSQADFASLQRSLLLRVTPIRIDVRWMRGRLALVATSGATLPKLFKEALKMAKLLDREKDPYASASAALLRAAIAARQGKRAEAIAILAAAAETAERDEIFLHAASARRRHGELLGGDEGAAIVAEADAWMTEQGVIDPARLTEIFAPGFSS